MYNLSKAYVCRKAYDRFSERIKIWKVDYKKKSGFAAKTLCEFITFKVDVFLYMSLLSYI